MLGRDRRIDVCKENKMTVQRARNIVIYGGNKPQGISAGRWNAIVKRINQESGEQNDYSSNTKRENTKGRSQRND